MNMNYSYALMFVLNDLKFHTLIILLKSVEFFKSMKTKKTGEFLKEPLFILTFLNKKYLNKFKVKTKKRCSSSFEL